MNTAVPYEHHGFLRKCYSCKQYAYFRKYCTNPDCRKFWPHEDYLKKIKKEQMQYVDWGSVSVPNVLPKELENIHDKKDKDKDEESKESPPKQNGGHYIVGELLAKSNVGEVKTEAKDENNDEADKLEEDSTGLKDKSLKEILNMCSKEQLRQAYLSKLVLDGSRDVESDP